MLTLGFLASGFPKITGDPMAAAGFAQAHLPLWFMYFIGIAEILGAIGLWVRRYSLATYAAYGLWVILAGAVVTTLIFTTTQVFAIVPVVYGIILGIIFWLGKK